MVMAAATAVIGQPTEAKEVQTKTYRHADFSVRVPFDWEEPTMSTDETVVLESKNKKASMTISVMHIEDGIEKAELKAAFMKFVQTRRNAEKEAATENVFLTEANVVDKGHMLYTKFGGYEKGADRQFIALITAERGKLLTFYIESVETTDGYVNNLAANVFNSIEVK